MSNNNKRDFEVKSKRFLQLSNHILMEYIYVGAPDDLDNTDDNLGFDFDNNIYTGSVGDGDVTGYCIVRNGWVGERYMVSASNADWKTGNGFSTTVLPVNKSCTRWVGFEQIERNGVLSYYSRYDSKWCGNIDGTPFAGQNEYCLAQDGGKNIYDVVRLYFQSGYIPEYDGFVVNMFSRNRGGVYFNYINRLLRNTDTLWMLAEPLWHADKIYTSYVEFRVPGTAWLSDFYNSQQPGYDPDTLGNTLVQNLSGGSGVSKSPVIGIELHGVTSRETDYGYTVYCTTPVVQTMLPCREENESVGVEILPADDGDYLILHSYMDGHQNETYSLFDYLGTFGNTFTFVHQVTVTEKFVGQDNGLEVFEHEPVTFVQTWEMLQRCRDEDRSPHPKFRPVLENTGDGWGADATYVLRITNNRDGSSILRECTSGISGFRKYGKHLVSIPINPESIDNPVHIYNRIENNTGVAVSGTGNPIGFMQESGSVVKINKYVVSSFIDKRNIKVSVSPVKIENVEQS